ncbi:MAG TPA: hypothetical protein VNO81_14395, partial [Candidatus Nitrosotenuis sp.]|nr:hypothetical protein [Candidatus Nitrosotenuis sp.]
VDTGGDVLDGSRRSRDRRMLELLRSCRAPVTLAVVAPGADGQNQARDLAAWSQDTGRFRGVVRLAELAPWLEQMAPHLERYERRKGRASTVTIIIRSLREGEPEVRVPREQEPLIPRAWLTRAFLYELERA